jgi:hypothetical protein
VAADKLNGGIWQALGGEPRQHLVPEQVRVDVLDDSGSGGVLLNDLLDAPRAVGPPVAALEQEAVVRAGLAVGF